MANPTPARMAYRPHEPVEVIGEAYRTDYEINLKIKPRGYNYFMITDDQDTLIFQIKKMVASLHDRHYLQDAKGKTLVTLRHKLTSIQGSWQIFRGESKDDKHEIFTVKKASIFQGGMPLNVFLSSNSAQEVPDFRIDGNDGCLQVFLGNGRTEIAVITTMKDHILMTVKPLVDYAFIASLAVFLGLKPSWEELPSLFSSLVGWATYGAQGAAAAGLA